MAEGDTELPPEVRAALTEGRTLEAIRRLREAEGLGLRDARRLVLAHERAQRRQQAPVRRGSVSSGSGIGRLALVSALVIGAVAAYRLLS